ncbi:UDP-N-acetylmuramoyl-tripeptide--D-alanyl-D-alanine ligase, partial [bacterium]|nr:UDP-N-acetylmuramoyl-tripeptide--D-alanyl-D-alanine ligase [bacterium]
MVIEIELEWLAYSLGSTSYSGQNPLEGSVRGVSIDTRNECRDSLFVAIEGENDNGNNYLEEAIRLGAGALLVSKANREGYKGISRVPIFEVDDTVEALQKIASLYKDRIGVKSVGITGSVGKTETKEMLASILSLKYRVHATPGNYNNQIGLPLTILGMDEDTEILVTEMGASHKGDIELLAGIAKLDVGIITNIGPGHLEYFGSIKGVAEAKSEILKSLSEEKVAILPADDYFFDYLKGKAKSDVVSFGFSEEADWNPEEIEKLSGGGYSFVLGGQDMQINRFGKYHILNVAAAAAAASCLDVPISDIADAVWGFRAIERRGRIYNVDGIFFVNDSYNS